MSYDANAVATRPTISLKNNKFLDIASKKLKFSPIAQNFPHSIRTICYLSLFSGGKQRRMILCHPPFTREQAFRRRVKTRGTCKRRGFEFACSTGQRTGLITSGLRR
jgi:hypothetical protein